MRELTSWYSDLRHLLENTFDRKRISANPNLKHNNVFGLTKWRLYQESIQKCTDSISRWSWRWNII